MVRTGHADSSRQSSPCSGQLQITVNSTSQYVVNGQTFAPNSPITLPGKEGPVTYHMLTSNSRTYVAIGTSSPVLLAGAKEKTTSTDDGLDLKFTRAPNGNFVLHGTTLVPGEPVTIGHGLSKTTLGVTTVNSTPAIVLGGSITELLGHYTSSNRIHPMSKFSAPSETEAASVTVLPTRTSSGVHRVELLLMNGALVALLLTLLCWN
jgi:hypothetical protein